MAYECSNCSGTHGVYKVDLSHYPGSSPVERGEKDVYFCVYCGCSHAGNAYLYPNQYSGSKDVMRAMAEMMNVLENRLRKKK